MNAQIDSTSHDFFSSPQTDFKSRLPAHSSYHSSLITLFPFFQIQIWNCWLRGVRHSLNTIGVTAHLSSRYELLNCLYTLIFDGIDRIHSFTHIPLPHKAEIMDKALHELLPREEDNGYSRGQRALFVTAVLTSVAALIVGMRLFARVGLMKVTGREDWAILISLVSRDDSAPLQVLR